LEQVLLHFAKQQEQIEPLNGGFGAISTQKLCPVCHVEINTQIEYSPGPVAIAVAAVLCCVGCFCFAWIPFVSKGLKDVIHRCPNCRTMLGKKPGSL